jgi:hypothetical protein
VAESGNTSRIRDLRTVGIPVVDQEQALTFYLETLGSEKRLDVPIGGGARWIEVAPPDAATTIALIRAHDDHAVRWTPTRDAECYTARRLTSPRHPDRASNNCTSLTRRSRNAASQYAK